MFVVMATNATEGEINRRQEPHPGRGADAIRPRGHGARGHRRRRRDRAAQAGPHEPARGAARRRDRHPDQPTVQADLARVPPGGHRHPGPRRDDRRRVADDDGRALLDREPGPAVGDGRRAWRRPAPRSSAAARSSRARARTRSRAWASRRSATWPRRATDRSAGHHRGDGAQPGRHRRRVRRHPPDRHPEHAELLAADGSRAGRPAGHAQARLRRDHRGVADGRRVHRQLRQPERDPVRARHPDLRDVHPQHARPGGRAAAPPPDPPAGHRRPEPRDRQALAGQAAVARRRGRRRRRRDGRGPPATRRGAVRRRAVDHARPVRRPHGGPPADPRPGPRRSTATRCCRAPPLKVGGASKH